MLKNMVLILGVTVSNLNFNQILEKIEKYLQKLKTQNSKLKNEALTPFIIFTPNPEIIVYARKDKNFKKIINSAQINIPDGWGVVWAAKILGQSIPTRIAGVDLMDKLVEMAWKKGLSIGLIGGSKGIALKTLECLKRNYPGLSGWAEEGPTIEVKSSRLEVQGDYKFSDLFKKIIENKTDIVFVGMGAPKQEYFINKIKNQIKINKPLVMMAVGGAFDYFSNKIKRAPKWIQNLGLEWLFRLIHQPWRFRRQLALGKFLFFIIKEKFS